MEQNPTCLRIPSSTHKFTNIPTTTTAAASTIIVSSIRLRIAIIRRVMKLPTQYPTPRVPESSAVSTASTTPATSATSATIATLSH